MGRIFYILTHVFHLHSVLELVHHEWQNACLAGGGDRCCPDGDSTMVVEIWYMYQCPLKTAYLIVPDGRICSVEFSFDVLVVVYLSCLFGIAKF